MNPKILFPNHPEHAELVNKYISLADKVHLKQFNDMLTKYKTRYYTSQTGKDAATDIYDTFLKYANGRSDIHVEYFQHQWLQPSVIARIDGNGPNRDQVVVIGAHEDSTSNNANAPGADDDASGVSTVLEVFRVLTEQNFIPSRTIEFHTYSAEEVGLRGSFDIANHYQKNGKNVVAMNQFDMTLFSGSGNNVGIVSDNVDIDLTTYLKMIVNSYSELGIIVTKCGYGCSDHASWSKAGYPSSFPFETDFKDLNKKIHTKDDLISHLNLDHGLEYVKIGIGYVVELALDPSMN